MTPTPPRVLVLGAGVAALETAFFLEQRLSGRVELAVVCDQDDFVLRPNLVYVPFGADWYDYSLRRLQENPKIAGYIAADTFGRLLPRRNGSPTD